MACGMTGGLRPCRMIDRVEAVEALRPILGEWVPSNDHERDLAMEGVRRGMAFTRRMAELLVKGAIADHVAEPDVVAALEILRVQIGALS